ncbi:MAG TPA: 16S rRNA (guanine(966)-N(2))-methyltransferase RsmD [Clostridia bacterium]|nr:16S rRNA (guanine(966)-N(2))-methyltransferase RsmD [Clostridia bacterium]
MRVIAGKFRSRNVQSLPGAETRPTYDRLKETLFNVLQSAGILEGARFLDLFAGTGSIGLEALSRGAAEVHFVEANRKAANVIRANLASFGITGGVVVHERAAAESLALLDRSGQEFDVCFFDPPYRMQGAYEQVLRLLANSRLMSSSGIVVAEHEKRFDPGDGIGQLRRYRLLTQGESSLSFYRFEAAVPAAEAEAQP